MHPVQHLFDLCSAQLCLAQLVVMFVAFQTYVADREVAECTLGNKLCNGNTRYMDEGCLSLFYVFNWYWHLHTIAVIDR